MMSQYDRKPVQRIIRRLLVTAGSDERADLILNMFQGIRAEQAAHREKLAGPTWAAISNWRPSAASRLRPRLGRRPSVRRPEFPRSSRTARRSLANRSGIGRPRE